MFYFSSSVAITRSYVIFCKIVHKLSRNYPDSVQKESRNFFSIDSVLVVNLERIQSCKLRSLIKSLYKKLDETTTYKNELVRKLLSVHEENEVLTKRAKYNEQN